MTAYPATPGRSVYAFPLLWMLSLAYACNFMDRSIVGTLAQAIKVDLILTDSQLGLLQGFAFVVLYSVVGLPLSRLAERFNRVNIIAICLVAWSGMTMACGLAQTFVQLLLLRVGVGVGEAGCNPCSHSMIADTFAPEARSRALSIYQMGATVGTTIGAIAAGAIADLFGWRMAFVLVGAPGLLLAGATRLFVKDPPRVDAHVTVEQANAARLSAVLRRLVTSPAIVHLVIGFTLASFAQGGLAAFTQAYFVRAFGLSYGQVGLLFGLSGGIASAASLIITGRLTDRGAIADVRWHAWWPIVGVALSIPCSIMAYTVGTWPIAVAWSFANSFFIGWFILPTLSALHKLVGVRLVATGMALVLMFQNLVGLGGGPYVTGVIIDLASQHLYSLHWLGQFATSCPGGAAHAGAATSAARACHAALVDGTRTGLLFTTVIRVWACAHYAWASRYVLRELGPIGKEARIATAG